MTIYLLAQRAWLMVTSSTALKMADVETAIQKLSERIQVAEDNLKVFHAKILELESASLLEPCTVPSPTSPEELKEQNCRLPYQILHLKKSIAEEEDLLMRSLVNVRRLLNGLFGTAVNATYPGIIGTNNLIHPTSNDKFGDYQFSGSMEISRALKTKGEKVSPHKIAASVIGNLPANNVIKGTEIAGPAFVNVHLEPASVSQRVSDLLVKGPLPPIVEKKRVVIDFSSPNIAKEMHVGHLRSTIIGETLSRLLEYVGHDVLRVNHVGDWGTQFGMLIAHLKDLFPNFSREVPPIGDLQAFYKESKTHFDNDPEFKKRAYSEVVKLQGGDPEVIQAWKLICDVSRKEFQRIYDRLGITVIERGESFYKDMMPDIVAELEAKNLVRLEEGRKVLFVPNVQIPLTLVKSDGGFTYDTSDMATLKQRVHDEKGDWLIYVVDLGQALHFQIVFEAGKLAGLYDPDKVRIDHVGFGVVLGPDKKRLKTRSGESVRLVDLLDEGLERSLNRLREKERDKVLTPDELRAAQEAVAYSCIKYADLSHERTNDYVFSFDKMLDDKGNTAAYLLYAYTRIRSIVRTSQLTAEQISSAARNTTIKLDHEKELKLAKAIIRFPEVICHTLDFLCPNHLCLYLYNLCTTFSEFYDNCYCIEKKKGSDEIECVHMDRILLCEAAALVLEKGFHILGLQPVGKM